MKAKIKSIISQMAFLGITGTMLMVGSSSCKKDNQKQAPPPPSYNAHDVKSMQNFFEQNSITNTKTNEVVFKEIDANFNVKEPATWNNNIGNPINSSIEFKNGRLANIRLNSPDFGGDLDLTGCLGLIFAELNGSNVASIKIPKKSCAGRMVWFFEKTTDELSVRTLQRVASLDELERVLSQYGKPPQGDIVLKDIFTANNGLYKYSLGAPPHPFINVSKKNITVTLVD